eukprot:EG_transcript_15945
MSNRQEDISSGIHVRKFDHSKVHLKKDGDVPAAKDLEPKVRVKKDKPAKQDKEVPTVECEPSKAVVSVDFILADDRDSKLVQPYHECGDPRMYTPELLRKRALLKKNAAVQDAISRFCRLFPAKEGLIPRDVYVSAHTAMSEILRPDLGPEERDVLAERDWQADTAGTGLLLEDTLEDVIFQFVDIWTQTVEPTEYSLLLDSLMIRIKDRKCASPPPPSP